MHLKQTLALTNPNNLYTRVFMCCQRYRIIDLKPDVSETKRITPIHILGLAEHASLAMSRTAPDRRASENKLSTFCASRQAPSVSESELSHQPCEGIIFVHVCLIDLLIFRPFRAHPRSFLSQDTFVRAQVYGRVFLS